MLPVHVANKIAAGEVVERPASVVKELVENAIDAGSKNIRISIAAGGSKLVSVQDDGCGMTKDDAVTSLERQATSKIFDVDDIEKIDTLGFRGEAIPSIASVSRFSITTRRRDSDEGTKVTVNAGELIEVISAGCPPGTLVEVRDLFCNVPARRKFLRAHVTEENHIKNIFTVHALAHPTIGFSLIVDGRELYRLSPCSNLRDRLSDIFGNEFIESLNPVNLQDSPVKVTGFIEKPHLSVPTRRDQYIFVNGRPATSPSIAYALREAYPRRQGESKPAAFIFLELSPTQVDVNVHPTKREVRFRNNIAVKNAIFNAIEQSLRGDTPQEKGLNVPPSPFPIPHSPFPPCGDTPQEAGLNVPRSPFPVPPSPVEIELPLAAEGTSAKPWKWFKFLASTASGYILIETDSGVVTINPHAARERIAFEKLIKNEDESNFSNTCQQLLIPEVVNLNPVDAARIRMSLEAINGMGFKIEDFGNDTFKIDAVPQLIGTLSPGALLSTIALDLSEGGAKRGGRWREDIIARSVARSFAGMSLALDENGAVKLVEELASCRMPYVCPRGKPIMIFMSTREMDRKFAKN